MAQGIHTTLSLNCFANTETPTRWEKLTACFPQARRPRRAGTGRMMMLTPTYLTTNRSEESTSLSRPLCTITVMLLNTATAPQPPPHLGHTVLRTVAHCGPPLPDKAIKVFFLTSSRTRSRRINSVLGHRCWLQLQEEDTHENSPLDSLPFLLPEEPDDRSGGRSRSAQLLWLWKPAASRSCPSLLGFLETDLLASGQCSSFIVTWWTSLLTLEVK